MSPIGIILGLLLVVVGVIALVLTLFYDWTALGTYQYYYAIIELLVIGLGVCVAVAP